MELPQYPSSFRLEQISRDKLQIILNDSKFLVAGSREVDLGVDMDVELLTDKSEATNIIFNVQLKATESILPSEEGIYGISIDTSNINYLLQNNCAVYILYDKSIDKFFYEFAEDFLFELKEYKPTWDTQQTNTIHFSKELGEQGLSELYDRVFRRSTFIRNTLTANLSIGKAAIDPNILTEKLNWLIINAKSNAELSKLLNEGRLDEAIATTKSSLDKLSKDAASQNFILAEMYALKDLLVDANFYYQKAHELDPNDFKYLLAYIDCLNRTGSPNQAIQIITKILSTNSLLSTEKSRILNSLSMASKHLGEFGKAAKYIREAIEIYKTENELNDEWTISLYNNMSMIYYNQYMQNKSKGYLYKKAIEWINKAFVLARDAPKHRLPQVDLVISIYNHMGLLYKTDNNIEKALYYYELANEIILKERGDQNLYYATHLNNYSGLLFILGRTSEAMANIEKVRQLEERFLGSNHPLLIKTYANMGWGCRQLGNLAKAKEYYSKALNLLNKSDGYYSNKRQEIETALVEIEKSLQSSK